ncbi:acVLRF1 family peptidyl-tRNA hydrolase [uncultured Arthrobacter sp.]|mgnify:CR=1 FL=1|uniref:acVLRF1 family peptidyl-tRNA hydrolase n=1 Tax=uncultured Arthrobacter sp. TaxID=114050 RepID=UPI00321684C7
MASPDTRVAFVSGNRLPGWVERFRASHGELREEPDDDGLRLLAVDGAAALLQPPWPDGGRPGRGDDSVARLASLASQPRRVGVVLVRRGGYSVAVVSEGRVLASKTGTRHVQSRTAAGGWSQQRFARRRANQADALVEAVADHAARIFEDQCVEYLVPGGDRTLAGQVLAEPALKRYAALVRLPFFDVPDPRAAVLKKAAADLCAVRIVVTEPPA